MKEIIDRRSVPRTIVGHSALILLHRRELYTCDVLDRTDRGARLDAGVLAFELHRLFSFSLDGFKTIRTSRLIWCHGGIVGIEFVRPKRVPVGATGGLLN